INAGTLVVQGVINGTSGIKVSGTGTLAGSGSIIPSLAGNIALLAGGRLSPGPGVATLALTLGGGGALDLSAGVTPANSQSLLFDLNNFATGDIVFITGGALKIGSGVLEFDDFVFNAPAGIADGVQDYVLFDGDTPIEGTLGTRISGPIGGF